MSGKWVGSNLNFQFIAIIAMTPDRSILPIGIKATKSTEDKAMGKNHKFC
jgi:hypothetical protein